MSDGSSTTYHLTMAEALELSLKASIETWSPSLAVPLEFTDQLVRIGLGTTANTRNQMPTAMSTHPPHRLTAGPVIRTGRSVSARTEETTSDPTMSRRENTTAVVASAERVVTGPTVRVWPARPASSGPVHPNPASRYPNS